MHIQINIEANEHQQEELVALLNDFNPDGYEQNDHALIVYFPKNGFDIASIDQILHGYDFSTSEIEEENWNRVWESNFDPVVVDNFCAVRAEFHQPISTVQHEIKITPKMSFGTGHHATTYMMIQQMKELDLKDKKVFDFGTGTGILAILAEKLGAVEIKAIDVDDWSIENANENVQRNNCHKISVSLSSEVPKEEFDIILANINRNVLLQFKTDLKKASKPGGFILLSGLLKEDGIDIINAFNAESLKLERQIERNNWISLLFRN